MIKVSCLFTEKFCWGIFIFTALLIFIDTFFDVCPKVNNNNNNNNNNDNNENI